MGEGEETDVLERISHFTNELLSFCFRGRRRQSEVDGGDAPGHRTHSL